ncbi:MAG: hypothetical protein AAFY76_14410 [Cyanobacteria bacterium J06649_11]
MNSLDNIALETYTQQVLGNEYIMTKALIHQCPAITKEIGIIQKITIPRDQKILVTKYVTRNGTKKGVSVYGAHVIGQAASADIALNFYYIPDVSPKNIHVSYMGMQDIKSFMNKTLQGDKNYCHTAPQEKRIYQTYADLVDNTSLLTNRP